MNKKQQLQELVRHIVRQTIKELTGSSTSLMGTSGQQQRTSLLDDPNQPQADDMSPLEKAKRDREQERLRRDTLKQSEAELKTIKAERDRSKATMDQIRRFKEPMMQKKIQALKGGQISTGSGM
jgi:hypothetical protein